MNSSVKTIVATVALLGAGFSACASAEVLKGEMLLYQKRESGIAPYPSRVIVTPGNLRLDDGVDDGDFALLDRKERMVYSVSHGDRTVLEIPFRQVDVESPVALNLSDTQIPSGEDAPTLAGRKPEHHRLLSGEKVCYDVVVVPGLMEETQQALSEFRQVMAGEHAATLPQIPADLHEPCDLGMNIYRHGWLLEHGLPIQEWDGKGNGQALVNFDPDYAVDSALFKLPEGYKHYRITPEE